MGILENLLKQKEINSFLATFFISCFFVFGLVNESWAAVYYVDKENKFGNSCNNTWSGTIAQPKCDFNHDWFMRGLEPGDEVIVREAPANGYGEIRLYADSTGTSQSPVVIRAYNEEQILLKAGLQFGIRLVDDVSYITFEDIVINGREYSLASNNVTIPHYGIKLQNCDISGSNHGPRFSNFHDSEIKNCEIHDLTVNGVQLNDGSTNITFDTVNVYRVSDGRPPADSDADGFHTYGGENIIINNCSSYDNSEDGFDMNANVTIANSKAYNNKGAGLKIWRRVTDGWADKTAIVLNSLFYNNGFYEPNPLDGNPGIKVSDGAKLELYNSVVYGNYDQGVKIRWDSEDGSYLADKIYPMSIIKNTIIADTLSGPGLEDTYRCTADTRNLQEDPHCSTVAHLTTESNNLYFNNPEGNAKGYNLSGVYSDFVLTSAVTSNPLFADASGGNFQLESGSGAISSGLDLSALNILYLENDFNGTTRPLCSNWDMGAYQYVDGAGDLVAPNAPNGLSAL